MDSGPICYASGEEIHLGDRVLLRGTYATVVAVSTGETYELAPGYEDQAGMDRGVIVCDDDGTINTLGEADSQLVFVDRG